MYKSANLRTRKMRKFSSVDITKWGRADQQPFRPVTYTGTPNEGPPVFVVEVQARL